MYEISRKVKFIENEGRTAVPGDWGGSVLWDEFSVLEDEKVLEMNDDGGYIIMSMY